MIKSAIIFIEFKYLPRASGDEPDVCPKNANGEKSAPRKRG